jgi:hypothetical protein
LICTNRSSVSVTVLSLIKSAELSRIIFKVANTHCGKENTGSVLVNKLARQSMAALVANNN